MEKFKIPVTWEVAGFVEVEADTIEEAIDKFDNEIIDTCELPEPGAYIDGSFDRSCRDLPKSDAAEVYMVYQD